MPRKYTEEDMRQALQALESGISLKQAVGQYGIPRQTLQDRLGRKTSSMGVAMERHQRIPREKETQICAWVLARAAQGEPPNNVQIVQHASCVLRESGDSKPLGKNWINGFIRRYPAVSGINSRKSEGRSFWESTDMDEENSKQAITTLSAFLLKGLPQHLVGVRARSEEELAAGDDSPSLIMACRDTSGTGMTILSTEHVRTLTKELDTVTSSLIRLVKGLPSRAKQNSVPRRVLRDPGHCNVEWGVFENMAMSVTEFALDGHWMLQPVFKKTLDVTGKITLQCKSNSEIEMEQLGPILGRSWFMRPLASTLEIYSAIFFYNQIKFLASGLEKKDNMLPWTFVSTYAGPFPTILWIRYISIIGSEAHMQFHARYITTEFMPANQPRQANDGGVFCILRKPYVLGRTGGRPGTMLSEGRVSIAVKTTTNAPNAHYSAVTLADSGVFQAAASGQMWDENLLPNNCDRFTGIAVFQSMLYHTLQLCREEHVKTAKAISECLLPLDKETRDLLANIVVETTKGLEKLVEDCREALENYTSHALDDQAKNDCSVLETRWESLIGTQQKIQEELLAAFSNLRVCSERPDIRC